MRKKQLILTGTAASAGTARGIVRIVSSEKDNRHFKDGEILVARITDPTLVMMMSRAAAIVCDIGSIVSHASIVSREMGIPCVVNTHEATKTLKNGMSVLVDGTKGKVFRIQ